MQERAIILTLFLMTACLCIDQTCSSNGGCPANSFCSSQYCRCNIPYILDCSIPAQPLSDSFQTFNVTNITTYYQTPNQSPNVYYNFLFQVCCSSTSLVNYDLNFTLWVDDGQPVLNSNNFVGAVSISLTQLVQAASCVDFVQYQVKLEQQPNGLVQNLIVGLIILPKSQSDFIDLASAPININVTIKQIVSSQLLVKLAIGVICFAAFIVICVVAFFCYRKYKAAQLEKEKLTYKQKLVEQFKKMTPQCQAKTLSIPTMSTCSICLGQFEPQQKVRKIVCKHIFHSQCIDGWCMKNLNCPICRLQLDEQSIKKKQKQVQLTNYHWRDNPLSDRQQLNQTLYR